MKPFRWNIKKREQLGRLVHGDLPLTYNGYLSDLRRCSARALAAAGDARLIFVGRSPENLFDYLSGVLEGTSWSRRVDIVNLSLRGAQPSDLLEGQAAAIRALRQHLTLYNLTPAEVASSTYPIAFVDLVASGSTFEELVEQLATWAEHDAVDVAATRRRIRLVGITWRRKTSPNAFRWHQHAPWLNRHPRIKVKNVSAPGVLWDLLGNQQQKVSFSHPPWRWGDAKYAAPPHDEEHIAALRHALHLYTLACDKAERLAFSAELARTPAMREPWCRTLVNELRTS